MLKGLQLSLKAKGLPVKPPDGKLVCFHTVGKALFETTHSRKINQSLLLPVLSYEHTHLRLVLTPFGSIQPAQAHVPIEKLAHLICSVLLVYVSAVSRSIFSAPERTNSLAVPMTTLTQNKMETMNGSILSKLFLTKTFIQMFILK